MMNRLYGEMSVEPASEKVARFIIRLSERRKS